MQKLTDPNPYEIFCVSTRADKPTIAKAYTAALRNPSLQKFQVQAAFHALMRPESRLLVDAFTIQDNCGEIDLEVVNNILTDGEPEIDWSNYLDYEAIFLQDLISLTEIAIRSLFDNVSAPIRTPTISIDFDGLDASIEKWLA